MNKRNFDSLLARVANEVHGKHLAIIGGFAVVLLTVLSVRGDINLNPFRAHAETGKTLTYEEVRNLVAQEMGVAGNPDFEVMKNQLALVDPNTGDPGQVLGMSTGLNISDPIDEVFPKELLELLKFVTIDDNSPESFKRYSETVVLIESENDMVSSLLALNSDDPNKLTEVTQNTRDMIGMMKSVEVPSELLEYHRLKVLYYATLGEVAQSLSGDPTVDINKSAKNMMTLMDRLGAIKNDIYQKYKLVI